MKKYKISLKSKDNHIFEYTCSAENFEIAIAEAINIIEKNGWSQHLYKVYKIEEEQ